VAAETTAVPRLRAEVAAAFSLAAVLLGMLGVYGVMSYTVEQRTQEIGIRMALGARAEQVARLIVSQVLTMTVVGLILGLAGALSAARLLATMLFGVKPGDLVTLGGTSFLLILAVLGASYPPVRKAARIDPVIALRRE
jgi:ABC-type antimicrobial peptide transport system permease subunit